MTTIDLLAEPRAITPATTTRTEVATATPKLPSIKETVLAQFREAEATVTALAEKYRAVAYDCATTAGMAAAKAARLELRERGRYAVQRAETAVKADVNDLKRVMSEEVERLVAIVRPVEDHVDGQIKAREATLAAEKAERERIAAEAAAKEAARVQMHRDNIARIRGYVAQAHGADAARLTKAVTFLGTINPGDEYEEFAAEAQQAVADTVATLGRMLAEATEREAEAARVRAQAVENARMAAELAEQRKQIEAQAAALKKQQDEAEAARLAAEEAAKPAPAPAPVAAAPAPAPVTAIEPEVQTINRSTRKAIAAEPVATKVDTATPAEMRNEWALFLEALQRVEPAIKQHAAFVDHTRYIRALDRFAGLFA